MTSRHEKRGRSRAKKALGCILAVCLALGALPSFMPAVTAAAAVIPVTPSGDATGAQDRAAVNSAVANARPGDTVLLSAGAFYINNAVNVSKSGITIAGAGKGDTTIISAGSGDMVYISNCHNVEITGITFDGGGRSGYGIHGYNCAALNIHDNMFTNITTNGIWFVGNQGVSSGNYSGGVVDSEILDNDFYSIGPDSDWGVGVRLSWGSSRNRVSGNNIDTTGRGGICANDGAMDCIITGNTVTNCGLRTEGLGIELWNSCDRPLVEDNNIDHWLSISGADYSAVRRNVISDHSRVCFLGIEAVATRQSVFTGNVIDGGSQIGISESNSAPKSFMYWGDNLIKDCVMWGAQMQGDGNYSVDHQYFYKNRFIDNNTPDSGIPGIPWGTPMYPGDNGFGFRVNGNTQYMTFDSNDFSNNLRSAFQITGGGSNSNWYFVNNTFDHNGYRADGTPASGISKGGFPIWPENATWENPPRQGGCDELYLDGTNTASGNTVSDNFNKPVDTTVNPGANPLTVSDTPWNNFTGTYAPPVTAVVCGPAGTAGSGMNFSFTSDKPIQYALWDFGEGLPSNDPDATHIYSVPGTFLVSLVTWDYSGQASRAEATVTIAGPPSAPVGPPVISAVKSQANTATITWEPTDLATGYIITFGDSNNPTVVNYPYPNATSYTITGLTKNEAVAVSVKAYNGLGASAPADTSVIAVDPPSITVKISGDGSLSLKWTAVNTASNYAVSYGEAPGVYTMTADAGTATEAVLTGLTNLRKYFFAVTATIAGGATVTSGEASATPGLDLPIYLSDLAADSSSSGALNNDHAEGGGPLTLNGVSYAKGVGTAAGSSLVYDLDGRFGALKAALGVDDGSAVSGSVTFTVSADGRTLYTSPARSKGQAPVMLDINIAGYSRLTITVTGAANCLADLADARLYEFYYISDMQAVSATSGWGGVHYNRNINGDPISIRGQVYEKGIWAHAASTIVYNLDARYSRFAADIGIEDSANGGGGNVRFRVYVDGERKYQSGAILSTAGPVTIDVDVSGGYTLTLEIVGNPSMDSAHCAWADARLYSALRPAYSQAQITGAKVMNGAIRLDWLGDGHATGYIVKYGAASGGYTVTLPVTSDNYCYVTGLSNGTAYYFNVVSDYGGIQVPSAEVSATPSSIIVLEFDDQTDNGYFGPASYPWARYTGVNGQYNGTEADTEMPGTWFVFDFVGTGAQVIGNKDWLYSFVDFYLDGEFASTCDCDNGSNGKWTNQTLFSVSGLPYGSHSVKGVVRGPGLSNGRTGASIDKFVVTTLAENPPTGNDIQSPSIAGPPEIAGTYYNSVYIRWDAAVDNNRVSEYIIFRNGEEAGRVPGYLCSFTDRPPIDGYNGVIFEYTVKAADPDGNISAPGPSAVITDDRCWDKVSYSGGWSQWENNGNFNRTKMYAQTAGASINYSFTGTSVSVAGEAGIGFGSVDVYVDDFTTPVMTADCSAPDWNLFNMPLFTVSGLADTGHVLRIVTKSAAEVDIDSFWTYPSWAPDSEAPSVPGAPRFTSFEYNKIGLEWPASTDNVRVAGYNVYKDGVYIGTTGTNSYTDTISVSVPYEDYNSAVYDKTKFTYTVDAFDDSENTSAQSQPIVILDNRDPSIRYTQNWQNWCSTEHLNGTTKYSNWLVNGSSADSGLEFDFSGTSVRYSAKTASGNGQVRLYVDGVLKATVNHGSSNGHGMPMYSITGLEDADHVFRLEPVSSATVEVDAFWYNPTVETIDEFTVTFYDGGAIWAEAAVSDGGTVGDGMPEAPVKEGYLFAGWFYDAGGTQAEFTSETPVTGDIAARAAWKADKTALDALIRYVESLFDTMPANHYTAESIAALGRALANAKAVSAREDATAGEVTAAREALQRALDGMTRAELVCAVKSMLAKVAKLQAIPYSWNGPSVPEFKTSNAAVCGVTADGTLIPMKAGIAVITIIAPNGATVIFAVTVSV